MWLRQNYLAQSLLVWPVRQEEVHHNLTFFSCLCEFYLSIQRLSGIVQISLHLYVEHQLACKFWHELQEKIHVCIRYLLSFVFPYSILVMDSFSEVENMYVNFDFCIDQFVNSDSCGHDLQFVCV